MVRASASTGGVGLTTCSRAQAPTTMRCSMPVRHCCKADFYQNIPCSLVLSYPISQGTYLGCICPRGLVYVSRQSGTHSRLLPTTRVVLTYVTNQRCGEGGLVDQYSILTDWDEGAVELSFASYQVAKARFIRLL